MRQTAVQNALKNTSDDVTLRIYVLRAVFTKVIWSCNIMYTYISAVWCFHVAGRHYVFMLCGTCTCRSLVDTVYQLRDEVRELRQEQERMRRDLDNSKIGQQRLEQLIVRKNATKGKNNSDANIAAVNQHTDGDSHTVNVTS